MISRMVIGVEKLSIPRGLRASLIVVGREIVRGISRDWTVGDPHGMHFFLLEE